MKWPEDGSVSRMPTRNQTFLRQTFFFSFLLSCDIALLLTTKVSQCCPSSARGLSPFRMQQLSFSPVEAPQRGRSRQSVFGSSQFACFSSHLLSGVTVTRLNLEKSLFLETYFHCFLFLFGIFAVSFLFPSTPIHFICCVRQCKSFCAECIGDKVGKFGRHGVQKKIVFPPADDSVSAQQF